MAEDRKPVRLRELTYINPAHFTIVPDLGHNLDKAIRELGELRQIERPYLGIDYSLD